MVSAVELERTPEPHGAQRPSGLRSRAVLTKEDVDTPRERRKRVAD